ncbi:MAG: OmpP1/FadL family transporter [Thermochromatium sp.]
MGWRHAGRTAPFRPSEAKLDSTLGTLSGDGYGLGFNLGSLYCQGAWSLGATYRSSATLDLEDDFSPKSSILVSLGRLACGQASELEFALPWRLQLGVRYAVDERWAIEFDISRTGWSAFNDIKVLGKHGGGVIFADRNDWNDANAYRFGATYRLNEQTRLHFGYTYDETGQGDDHFSARVPDNDRHLFSLGLAQSLGDGVSLEAVYIVFAPWIATTAAFVPTRAAISTVRPRWPATTAWMRI